MIKLLFIPTLLALIGCKDLGIGSGDDPRFTKACNLAWSESAIRAHITSPSPLPANLAISLNGDDVDADECVNNGPFFSSVEVSADRMQATAIFNLNGNSDAFNFYFPNGPEKAPQSDRMNLGFFSRAVCTEVQTKFDEVLDIQITWQPIYANGEDCGVTSHVADSEVQTH